MQKNIQIGVMGSCSDMNYSKKIEKIAERVGYWVAQSGSTLLFGAEKDFDSLSTAACRGAKKAGGRTVGVTYGNNKFIKEKTADTIIVTGLERGGGRETSLVFSCDVIITINGGSGTLTEMLIAYQAGIPIVALKGSGGWSDRMINKYFDNRKRLKVEGANNPRRAVSLAIDLVKKQKRPLLFLAATHGNETIGVDIMKKVENKYPVNWIIGNKPAMLSGIRYIGTDLNRSAPGDINGIKYETRRAAQVIAESKKYRGVIDIHGTNSRTGIFLIITKLNKENFDLAMSLPVKRIVIWERSDKFAAGPITAFVPAGVEIECGPQNSISVKKQLQRVVEEIIKIDEKGGNANRSGKEFYYVFGKLSGAGKASSGWREFRKINYGKISFYPLLINRYSGFWCYQMRRVFLSEIENRLL